METTAGDFELRSVAGDELRPEFEARDQISAVALSFSEPSLVDDWSQERLRLLAPETDNEVEVTSAMLRWSEGSG